MPISRKHLLLQASLLDGACVQPVWHTLWVEADESTAATRSKTFRKLHMGGRRMVGLADPSRLMNRYTGTFYLPRGKVLTNSAPCRR